MRAPLWYLVELFRFSAAKNLTPNVLTVWYTAGRIEIYCPAFNFIEHLNHPHVFSCLQLMLGPQRKKPGRNKKNEI